MATAICQDPAVEWLRITTVDGNVTGLIAQVAYSVTVQGEGVTVSARKEADVWEMLSQGQKNQFANLLQHILQQM